MGEMSQMTAVLGSGTAGFGLTKFDALLAWARKYWSTIEPLTSGFYVNEVNDESRAVLNANYRENYPRMVAVKKQYDPANLFRLNANVTPACSRPVADIPLVVKLAVQP